MGSKYLHFVWLLVFVACYLPVSAQQQAHFPGTCGTAELMQSYYDANPAMKTEAEELEKFTLDYTLDKAAAKTTTAKYVIPMVFHVYGTTQAGYTVNDTLIRTAVQWLNEDFHGKNPDYGAVNTQFLTIRDTLDVEFKLARKSPNGTPTTGIIYYPVKAGYAKSDAATLAKIAADAWDNNKYLNVYVMADLYDNGDLNQSGVGTYPSTALVNSKTARIVYNGKYLAYNYASVPEFYSVLTHECGHFFNLIHTFQGGCTMPNDNVGDTPPCAQAQGCHISASSNTPLNCNNNLVNSENYMDYNYNCYKMFTKGQVARMTAALNNAPLLSLWQPSNLTATGLLGVNDLQQDFEVLNLYPNPTSGCFSFNIHAKTAEAYTVVITDITGRNVYKSDQQLNIGTHTLGADIKSQAAGLYLLRVKSAAGQQVFKIQLQ